MMLLPCASGRAERGASRSGCVPAGCGAPLLTPAAVAGQGPSHEGSSRHVSHLAPGAAREALIAAWLSSPSLRGGAVALSCGGWQATKLSMVPDTWHLIRGYCPIRLCMRCPACLRCECELVGEQCLSVPRAALKFARKSSWRRRHRNFDACVTQTCFQGVASHHSLDSIVALSVDQYQEPS